MIYLGVDSPDGVEGRPREDLLHSMGRAAIEFQKTLDTAWDDSRDERGRPNIEQLFGTKPTF